MLIVGHRGAKGLASENTVTSFDAALKYRVDGIELDVRTTSDNVPVVIHNVTVQIGGKAIPVKLATYALLSHNLPGLLTLDEALKYLKGKTQVIIEIKPGVTVHPVVAILEQHARNWPYGGIKVSSYDLRILLAITRVLPGLDVIVNERWSGLRASYKARKLQTIYITMNQRWLWRGFIGVMKRRGFRLTAYTLNNVTKAQHFDKAGLYACITDYPDRFNTES